MGLLRGHVVDERRAGSAGDAEDVRLGGSRGWTPNVNRSIDLIAKPASSIRRPVSRLR
jgi:hypothetical protein